MRMLPATPHLTAENFRVAPTPITDDVMTWVVEIGALKRYAVANMIDAPVVSAAKPCGGSSSMILRPRVRMMRQPPA